MGNPQIKINDGSKVYEITNQRGEVLGAFTFIPSDIGVVGRYEHTVKEFEKIQSEMADVSAEKLPEYEERMKKEIDYLFNADVSGSFFSITSPFTILASGQFYVENVINAVNQIIESETDIRLKRVESKASKYTKKYHK